MLASEVLTVAIARPYPEVLQFLEDRFNFVRWASLPDSIMEPLGGEDWLVDLPGGRRVIRFSPRNTFGIFDYEVFEPGETGGPRTPVRLVPNEEGSLLILVWFRRPGMSVERFRSELDWAQSDLQRLKTLLEGG